MHAIDVTLAWIARIQSIVNRSRSYSRKLGKSSPKGRNHERVSRGKSNEGEREETRSLSFFRFARRSITDYASLRFLSEPRIYLIDRRPPGILCERVLLRPDDLFPVETPRIRLHTNDIFHGEFPAAILSTCCLQKRR